MKKDTKKESVIARLKQMPIIQIACTKAGISRATFYRWCSEDKKFKEEADAAMSEGEAYITDMSESQLISLIRDKNFPSIQLWLRQHHPKYGNKLEILAGIKQDEKLTPEQEELVRKALKLASFSCKDINNPKQEEKNEQ